MKSKEFFIKTLKKVSLNNKVISYKLMLKSGMIEKISSGIYSYMPLGLKIIKKFEKIIRIEMKKNKVIEILMPIVQPAKIWKQTKRFKNMGKELVRFKDRKNNNFIIQSTCEELITYIAKKKIKSYKQLPINFYHIQTKFRDELRPRFGLIRCREFIMKDAYSFDKNIKNLKKTYNIMYNAYINILKRIKLNFKIVLADTGNIGGMISHEFHALNKYGEDYIVYSSKSNYASNIELAKTINFKKKRFINSKKLPKIIKIKTKKKIKNNIFIKIIPIIINKSIKNKKWIIIINNKHKLNKKKLNKIKIFNKCYFLKNNEIFNIFKVQKKFICPLNLKKKINILIDYSLLYEKNFICGANKKNYYYINVNWSKKILNRAIFLDIRNVLEGERSPDKKGFLKIKKSIEIAHIFQLGTIYSKLLNANFNYKGKNNFLQMGCYGLGITRILSALIEQNFDNKGIIWPKNSISPFEVVICPINFKKDKKVKKKSKFLYNILKKNKIDVILDNRNYHIGNMLSDWELIGIPHFIIISIRMLKNLRVEYKYRKNISKSKFIKIKNLLYFLKKKINNII